MVILYTIEDPCSTIQGVNKQSTRKSMKGLLFWVVAFLLSFLGIAFGQELLEVGNVQGVDELQSVLAPIETIYIVFLYQTDYTYTSGGSAVFTLTASDTSTVVTVQLICDNFFGDIQYYTANGDARTYNIDGSAYGQCRFDFYSEGNTFSPSDSQTVYIYTPLTFQSPQYGDTFNTSSTIDYTLFDPSGRYPVVDLNLTCENTLAGQGSGNITEPIPIGSLQSYGNCITTISTNDPYFITTATLNITVVRNLTVTLPNTDYYVPSGTYFDIAVLADLGDNADLATITVVCDNGTFATFDVNVNTLTNPTLLPTDVNGLCTFSAASYTAPYYTTGPSASLFAQANTSFISPVLGDGWTYFAGNSLINITSTYNDIPPPVTDVAITCSYNSAPTLDTQLTVYNGVYENYNSTGYGECTISTLFSDGGYYLNSSSTFYSRATVTLTVPDPFYDTEYITVLASSDIADQYDMILVVNCTNGHSSFIIQNNVQAIINYPGIEAGTTCYFQTLPDRAFYASQNESREVIAPTLTVEVTTNYPIAGVPFGVNISSNDFAQTILVLNCQSFDTVRTPYAVTNDFQDYTIPADYYGDCLMYATNLINQVISDPVRLTAYSLLAISSPPDGSVYTYGQEISVNVTAATGDPSITVQLDCNSQTNQITQNVSSLFVFEADPLQYGACTISIVQAPPTYNYTNAAIGVEIYRQLVLNSPAEGDTIIGGAYYTLNITSTDGVSSAPVIFGGDCYFGSVSQETTANTEVSVPMTASAQGECILTAYTTEPYYYNSSGVNVIIQANVTVVTPNLETDWTYLGNNTGSIFISSGQNLTLSQGINISCQYLGVPNYNQQFDVTDNAFASEETAGYGLCTAQPLFNATLFHNTPALFRTRTSVSLATQPQAFQKSTTNDAQSLLLLWHNSIFNQPQTDIHQFVNPETNTWLI